MIDRKVSIGIPVYNGEIYMRKVLDNIIKQKYPNKEIIISDSCSQDNTQSICKIYTSKYKFIKYFRHKKKIDIFKNFNFVLQKAKGEFFTWQAQDDLRTKNFLKNNIRNLNYDNSLVASTGISIFDKKKFKNKSYIDFDLRKDIFANLNIFFKNKWFLNGIFYSVVRLKILKKFPFNNFPNYFARDLTVILYLIRCGLIKRDLGSKSYFGSKGLSFHPQTLKLQKLNKNSFLEYFFPFIHFTRHAVFLYKEEKILIKILLIFYLVKLNTFTGLYLVIKNFLYNWRVKFSSLLSGPDQ